MNKLQNNKICHNKITTATYTIKSTNTSSSNHNPIKHPQAPKNMNGHTINNHNFLCFNKPKVHSSNKQTHTQSNKTTKTKKPNSKY